MTAEPTVEMDNELATPVLSHNAQLETLFNRITVAKNHYEVLGIGFDADGEEIRNSKLAADALLQTLTLLPQATFIMARVNHSYRVLAGAGTRRDYDYHLCTVENKDESRSGTSREECRITDDAGATSFSVVSEEQVIRRQTGPLSFTSDFRPVDNSVERRRYRRFGLTVPVYIRGYKRDKGWWKELTQTIDVSRSGLSFYIQHSVRQDTVLHLTFAMPTDLRACQFQSPDYSIYAIVRRVGLAENGIRTMAAVSFIGEQALSGFAPESWAEYPKDEPVESAGMNAEAEVSAWG